MMEQILKERGNRYGEFAEHARITQEIKDTMVSGSSWNDCDDSQREALEMIAHKIGRIVNGDPSYEDSWTDICGYSQLVVDQLQKENEEDEEDSFSLEGFDALIAGWGDLLDEISNPEPAVDETKQPETVTEDIQLIEINGIKVFISGSELEKLEALKESEETTDHEDQTYMHFNKAQTQEEKELSYAEFLKAQGI